MQDLRDAARWFRGSPGAFSVGLLSLGLGIGATVAIFSLVNAILLRPLPVRDPHRLATISSESALAHGFMAGHGWNLPMWQRFQPLAEIFEGLLAWTSGELDLASSGQRQPVDGLFVSGSFFTTLGVHPRAGRLLWPADDNGAAEGPVAVISERFWERRFGRRDVVGHALLIEGVPVTIVGVTPRAFLGVEAGRAFDVALPLGSEPLVRGSGSILAGNSFMLTVMVRLAPGQSIESGTARLRTIQPAILGVERAQLSTVSPRFLAEPFTLVRAATGTADASRVRATYGKPLLILLAGVALVLVIGCLNVANLLLGVLEERRHELAVRLALGATRWRLSRPCWAASAFLAAAATLVALVLAQWIIRGVLALATRFDGELLVGAVIDWRVLAFSGAAGLVTALLVAAAPAAFAGRAPPARLLQVASQAGSARAPRQTLAGGLLVAQTALSLVLVFATGLLIRSFQQFTDTPLGLNAEGVLILEADTARAALLPADRLPLYQRLADRLQAVPGITDAAASRLTPLSAASNSPLLAQPDIVPRNAVSPGWFDVYGIRILVGRDFDQDDTASAPAVAIVNEAYVRRFFPDRDPLGQAVDGRVVVGVTGTAVFNSLRSGLRPAVFVPLAQSADQWAPQRTQVSLSVRAESVTSPQVIQRLGAALNDVDPRVTFSARTLRTDLERSTSVDRLLAILATFFGLQALLLGALGVYGVSSHAVHRQRREIAIRMALGLTSSGMIRLVLARVLLLTAAGVAVGVPVSVWLSQSLAALLHGVQPGDPTTLIGSAALLVLVALAAGWGPARRAAAVDAAQLLRGD
jgi:putative ABC transport system permease protein